MGLAKKAEPPDWEGRLSEQEDRLRQIMPPSRDEAQAEAKTRIDAMRRKAYILGYAMRGQHAPKAEQQLAELSGAIQPQQETVEVPAVKAGEDKKALLGPIIEPIQALLQSARHTVPMNARLALQGPTAVTADPTTLPGYGAQASGAVASGFQEGVGHATEDMKKDIHGKLDTELAQAKTEFEAAMASETAGAKEAGELGRLLDKAAAEKSAEGELNKLLNLYLAAAGLVGAAGHAAGRSAVAGRLPEYARAKAIKDLARQRTQEAPVLIAPQKELALDEPDAGEEEPEPAVTQPVTA